MNAEALARALGGHRSGNTWLACCPAHDDRKPSLAVRDGGDGYVLVHCHAGCDQRDVIDALRRRGLWDRTESPRRYRTPASSKAPAPDITRRLEAALRIWDASDDAAGTPVAAYLTTRGLVLPSSDRIRFHPCLSHPTGGAWPAMVALVSDATDAAVGVHRTFLARDGSGKAPVSPARMALGAIRGGSVRLAPAATRIVIGEGIESVLSVTQNTGAPGWAALSTSGLRTLILPRLVEDVVIVADADPPGEAAARDAAERWTREGRRVRIARPTPGFNDFNDMLKDRIPARRTA